MHVAVLGDQLQSPSLPQSPMLQGMESQPHTFHPSTELLAPPVSDQWARATSPTTSTPAERPWPGQGHEAHLDSILHVGGLVDTALALRVGTHTNCLFYHVAIAKNQVLPM